MTSILDHLIASGSDDLHFDTESSEAISFTPFVDIAQATIPGTIPDAIFDGRTAAEHYISNVTSSRVDMDGSDLRRTRTSFAASCSNTPLNCENHFAPTFSPLQYYVDV